MTVFLLQLSDLWEQFATQMSNTPTYLYLIMVGVVAIALVVLLILRLTVGRRGQKRRRRTDSLTVVEAVSKDAPTSAEPAEDAALSNADALQPHRPHTEISAASQQSKADDRGDVKPFIFRASDDDR